LETKKMKKNIRSKKEKKMAKNNPKITKIGVR